MYPNRIIVTVSNDLANDQRVHRICDALANNNYNVHLIGRKKKNSVPLIERNYSTDRIKLLFNKGFLFYSCLNFRLFFKLLFSKFDILVANDLDTLPANALVKIIRRKKLVFDAHELFYEVPELNGETFVKWFWKTIEKVFIRFADAYMTVSPSITEYYYRKYKIHFEVIRNLPLKIAELKEYHYRENLLIYQGALNKDRGIETLIEAMQYIEGWKLIIAGIGDLESELKCLAEKLKVNTKVQFTGHLDFDSLRAINQNCKLGFSLEKDTCLNYRWALPNKIFDYINSGIPVLCSNLPEMRRIIEQYNCGEMVESGISAKELSETIISLTSNSEKLKTYHKACLKAREQLNWENESQNLFKIYNNLA